MDAFVAWVVAHPSEFAWLVFAVLSALVWTYYRAEPAIKAYVERTTESWDDRAFARVQRVGAFVKWFVDLLAVILPTFAGRRPKVTPPIVASKEEAE